MSDAAAPTPAQADLLARLTALLGPRVVVTDPDLIEPWLHDWRGRYHGRSPALLQPTTTAQVAAIVGAAAMAGVPLVPQGGNTSMVGGATPPADGAALILSLRRLNRVRHVDAEAGLIVAEAGVVLADLHDAAMAAGRRFPLTLGARGSATLGGLVSTNAGGTQVLRHGTMRGLVAGVEAVLPDGSVFDGLAALKKDNRGYDVRELLVGAEGTLGVVTAATLRLVPAIADRAVAWVGVAGPTAALALLRRFDAAGDAVESFELINGALIDLAVGQGGGGRAPLAAPAPWQVLIEAVSHGGDDEAPATLIERVIGAALADGLLLDATLAASEAQAEAFWHLRHGLSDAQRAAGAVVAHDISVPVETMPGFIVEQAAAIARAFPGARMLGFGHLGDGNIHFDALSPPGADREAWYRDHAAAVTRFVNDAVVAAGGSISAEHGIGQMKRDELVRLSSPARLAVLTGVKRALDPQGLFNPGKLVP